MKSYLAALVLLTTCVLAGGAPTRADALAAIATLETDLLSDEGFEASRTIAQFAEESEEVIFVLGPETVPWVTEERPPNDPAEDAVRALLLAVYFAGNAKSQLLAKKTEDDPYSGWIAVLRAYRQIQAKRPVEIPSLEQFSELEANGALQAHARETKEKLSDANPVPESSAPRRDNSF